MSDDLHLTMREIYLKSPGEKILHHASSCGYVEEIKLAILKGANIDDQISDGHRTALMQSIANKHVDCAKYLLSQSANPNLSDIRGLTAMHFAATSNNTEMIK